MTTNGNGKEWRKFILLYIVAIVALGIAIAGMAQLATGSEDEGGKSALDTEHIRAVTEKALDVALISAAIGVLGTAALAFVPGIGSLLAKKNSNTTERS